MQISKKNLSIIILTSVFVLSVIISIVIGNIKTKPAPAPGTSTNEAPISSEVETEIVENGGTTAIIPAVTKKPVATGPTNVLDGIMDGIYDNNRPVITNPSYGNNVNTGADGYELDGTAVTTIYDTVESTKNGETTKPEPETTIANQTSEKIVENKKASEETTGNDVQKASASPEGR